MGHPEPLWEFATDDEGCESGIVSKGVPLGIDGQEDQVDVPGFEGAVEPLEGCVGFVEAGMNERRGVGRNVTLAGD
jgi:hypothetical protein